MERDITICPVIGRMSCHEIVIKSFTLGPVITKWASCNIVNHISYQTVLCGLQLCHVVFNHVSHHLQSYHVIFSQINDKASYGASTGTSRRMNNMNYNKNLNKLFHYWKLTYRVVDSNVTRLYLWNSFRTEFVWHEESF